MPIQGGVNVITLHLTPQDGSPGKKLRQTVRPDGTAWIPVEEASQEIPPSFILAGADGENPILLDRSTATLIWCPLATESSG